MDGTGDDGLADSIHDDGQPSHRSELLQSLLPYDVTEECVVDPCHGGPYWPPVPSPGSGPWVCRSGAREIRPPKLEKGAIAIGAARGRWRGSTRIPCPSVISHSWVSRTVGLARILATVRPSRNVSPSSIQFIKMMLSTSELIPKAPIMDDMPSISGFRSTWGTCSSSVSMRLGSPSRAPSAMYWSAITLLPTPEIPATTVVLPRKYPPFTISSSPGTPVVARLLGSKAAARSRLALRGAWTRR